MKRKFITLAVAALATMGLAQAQNPTATVTLGNGAQLTFSTWTYQGVTNACLDDVSNTDGKTIDIPSSVTIAGTQYDVTMVGPYAFMNAGLTGVVIPDVCTDIYYGAFDGCTALTTVTIGSGVTEIADGAFFGCTALTTVHYNAANATTDASYAFGGVFGECEALTTFHFGPDVQTLDDDIFFSLNATAQLTTITIEAERLLNIGSSNFFGYGQSGLSITVPCSQQAAYQADAAWSGLGTISSDCGGAVSHTLTVSASDAAMGSAWGSCTFIGDTIARIYATPAAGHAFLGWNDGNGDNPRNILVDADSTVTALFSALDGTVCDSVNIIDSIHVVDSLNIIDSVRIVDSVVYTYIDSVAMVYDTTVVTVYDTVHITIYDTVTVRIESVDGNAIKVYLSEGQIVVEGAIAGESIDLYDAAGRALVRTTATPYTTRIALPHSGAYLVNVGNRQTRKIVVNR